MNENIEGGATTFEEAMQARMERVTREGKARNKLTDFVKVAIRQLRADVEGHGGEMRILQAPGFMHEHVVAGIMVRFPPEKRLEDAHITLDLSRMDQIDGETRYLFSANDHKAPVESHEQAMQVIYEALK
ncbi:hypothetical protein [Deinococcus sp. 6GRE01]|uniref:hypothetical protein n=1 Tax=Deinococcus sp. 6GRE01 TaxID=2745873 RepID=UPI001E46B002|nr:hypothetical protein [Deinococcus sp. 6GRE01]MCD0156027.1 hypothetical protein [Deinococcus sp. 6GRE01]